MWGETSGGGTPKETQPIGEAVTAVSAFMRAISASEEHIKGWPKTPGFMLYETNRVCASLYDDIMAVAGCMEADDLSEFVVSMFTALDGEGKKILTPSVAAEMLAKINEVDADGPKRSHT